MIQVEKDYYSKMKSKLYHQKHFRKNKIKKTSKYTIDNISRYGISKNDKSFRQ